MIITYVIEGIMMAIGIAIILSSKEHIGAGIGLICGSIIGTIIVSSM